MKQWSYRVGVNCRRTSWETQSSLCTKRGLAETCWRVRNF